MISIARFWDKQKHGYTDKQIHIMRLSDQAHSLTLLNFPLIKLIDFLVLVFTPHFLILFNFLIFLLLILFAFLLVILFVFFFYKYSVIFFFLQKATTNVKLSIQLFPAIQGKTLASSVGGEML